MDVEGVLAHHGIKGMRWGIRNKVDSRTGRVTVDYKTANDLRKKPKTSLTNKQLQTVNTRLGLEQNFDRLNPGTIKRGEKHIKAVVATAGLISSVAAIANSPAGKPIAAFINRHKGRRINLKPGSSFI